MTYFGAFATNSIITYLFTSRGSTGVPTALVAGAPGGVEIYKNGGTSQVTVGVSLTTNFDSRAGLNMLVIDSSASAAFYNAGSDFAGVLGSVSTVEVQAVSGEVVLQFSINSGVLPPNSIGVSSFAADSITSAKIADDALGPEHFADNAFVSTTLAPSAYTEIAKSIMTASLAGSGVPHATRNVAAALSPLRNFVDASSSVVTVYAEDDSTSRWTGSITTGTNAIRSVNPA